MKNSLAFIIHAVFALGMLSCSDEGDNSAGGDGELTADLTQYEDDVADWLDAPFGGTVSDYGGNIPCRFAGEPFTFDLTMSSIEDCYINDWDPNLQPTECTDAMIGEMPLGGTLTISSSSYPVSGYVKVGFLNSDSDDAEIIMHVTIDPEETPDDGLDGNFYESGPIGRAFTIFWEFNHGDTDTAVWESCRMDIAE